MGEHMPRTEYTFARSLTRRTAITVDGRTAHEWAQPIILDWSAMQRNEWAMDQCRTLDCERRASEVRARRSLTGRVRAAAASLLAFLG